MTCIKAWGWTASLWDMLWQGPERPTVGSVPEDYWDNQGKRGETGEKVVFLRNSVVKKPELTPQHVKKCWF